MEYLVMLASLFAIAMGDVAYLPPYNTGGGAFGNSGAGFFGGSGRFIPIIRYNNVNNGDGSYNWDYETGNGISANERGDARGDGTRANGGFSYTAPNGERINLQYTADENGFRPVGSHLPTPPPIPEAILRSIEFNRANPGDDGQYRPGAYDSSGGGFGAFGGYRY